MKKSSIRKAALRLWVLMCVPLAFFTCVSAAQTDAPPVAWLFMMAIGAAMTGVPILALRWVLSAFAEDDDPTSPS